MIRLRDFDPDKDYFFVTRGIRVILPSSPEAGFYSTLLDLLLLLDSSTDILEASSDNECFDDHPASNMLRAYFLMKIAGDGTVDEFHDRLLRSPDLHRLCGFDEDIPSAGTLEAFFNLPESVDARAHVYEKVLRPEGDFYDNGDLRRRGWSNSLLKNFTPEPDFMMEGKSPLYRVEKIEKVEKTPEFVEAMKRVERAREISQFYKENVQRERPPGLTDSQWERRNWKENLRERSTDERRDRVASNKNRKDRERRDRNARHDAMTEGSRAMSRMPDGGGGMYSPGLNHR